MTGLTWAARLAALATGHAGPPGPGEWPLVGAALLLLAVAGTWLLRSAGLTRLEAALVAIVAPVLVLVDAPLGQVSPQVSLAANLAGCVVPCAVGAKILVERRLPGAEAVVVVGLGVLVSFAASRVVPDRGILLQYRVPALVIGVASAALLHKRAEAAGAAAFAGGGLGVVFGADLMHLRSLADSGGAGRIILGGAGLLDGIYLVALLSAFVAEATAVVLRAALHVKAPARGGAV
ncbi:MAG: hypothetical protein QOE90_187 [Thermoplasmata archaeon]|jgi:hypothetical protein|nr:hypothetical protein [Thermoplasmata archaeon]